MDVITKVVVEEPIRTFRLIGTYFFIAMLVLATTTRIASGQTVTTGDVTGVAVDSAGAVVANAEVTLKNLDMGATRSVRSSATGLYRFTFVQPDRYELSASSADLQSDKIQLAVDVGQVASVNLSMKLRAQQEVVAVTGAIPLLDRDDAHVTYALSSRQMDMLPLPGGDLVAVAYTAPAVVINDKHGTGNFAAAGIGSVSNLFTVNGADDMDPYFNVNNSGVTNLLLGANEIQQASVIENAYEGQYGRQAGAQVNYVSKSGSNAYHGNGAYTYNGNVLNANDYFANASSLKRPHEVSNQYAASVGGHVVRDKLFFFLDTEGLRYALPGSVNFTAVPSQALEGYALRTVLPYQAPLYQKAFSLYNAAPGHDRAVPVINGNGPLQDGSGRLGCGTLAGTPTGNGGTFGTDVSCADAFAEFYPMQTAEWLISGRLDYNISTRQSLFLRLKTDHGSVPINISAISPVFNLVSNQPDYETQLSYTYAMTPRLVMNVIGSASYYSFPFEPLNVLAAENAFPFRFNISDGGANYTGGIAPLGAPAGLTSGRRATQLQIVDDVSYAIGNHLLKFGVNYRSNNEADLSNSTQTKIGRFNFNGLNEFASGALNPASGSFYTQAFTAVPVVHLHLYNIGAYAQDQWAIAPHLKLTVAMRLDRTGNPYCAERCFARLINPFAGITKGLDVPYNASIQDNLSHAFYRIEPIVVQPRVSFAYSPNWSRDTVFRGGLGIFSDLYPASFASNVAQNAPNVYTPSVHQGLVAIAGPDSSPAIAAASATAFQGSFAGGATLPQLQQAVFPAQFSSPPFFSLPTTLQNPRYVEWSFEAEHQLGEKNVIGLRYIGNHGYNTFIGNAMANASVSTVTYPNGFGGLPTTPPDPRFNIVTQLTNAGYSNYNGMTAFARRTVGSGFQGQISYTWSHSLDLVSDGGEALFNSNSYFADQLNPYDLRSLNYSSSDYDARHNLEGDFIWDLPFKVQNRRLNSILSGWSIASKMSAHTGTPFSVYNAGFFFGGIASLGEFVLAAVVDPNIQTNCGSSIHKPCFTQSAFTSTATQTNFGNRPRNSFRGPGYFDIDSSLYKTIVIREGISLRIAATAYNVLNHPNFADPFNDAFFAGVGSISSTVTLPSSPYGLYGGPSSRVVALTGKLDF